MADEPVWDGAAPLREMLVPLVTLEPWPDNPRRGDVEALRANLRRFGQLKPVVVQGLRIVAGHHVVKAAMAEGWTHVAVLEGDFESEEEARAFLLADNRSSELGDIDEQALAGQLALLRSLEGVGYTRADVDDLDARLAELRGEGATGDDDPDPPPPPEEPKSQLGEAYELGPHLLVCGDATDDATLERLTGADLVFTDPPYAIYGSSTGLSASVTDDKIVRPFFRAALAAAERCTPLFAPIFVCCDWRSWPSWWEVAKSTRVQPKNLLVWDKGDFGLGSNFANTYELVGYFLHMPEQKTMTGAQKKGIRPIMRSNIVRVSRPSGAERQHNAAKPLALIDALLDVASEPGDTVLDLFAGSGSTLIAADRAGRRCLAVEVEPAWCDVVRRRYAEHSGDMSLAP